MLASATRGMFYITTCGQKRDEIKRSCYVHTVGATLGKLKRQSINSFLFSTTTEEKKQISYICTDAATMRKATYVCLVHALPTYGIFTKGPAITKPPKHPSSLFHPPYRLCESEQYHRRRYGRAMVRAFGVEGEQVRRNISN